MGTTREIHELIYTSNAELLEKDKLKYLELANAEKSALSEKLKNDKIEIQSAVQKSTELRAAKTMEVTEFKNAEKLKLDSALATQRELRKQDSANRFLPTGTGLTTGTIGAGSVMLGSPQALQMQAKYEAGLISAKTHTNMLSTATSQLNGVLMGLAGGGLLTAVYKLQQIELESEKFHIALNDFTDTGFAGNTEESEKQLELFRIAVARTVNDGNLVTISNWMRDLGIGMKDQTIILAAAENATDKYGGSVEDNARKITTATESGTKGLKQVGVQVEVYKQNLQNLAKEYGTEIEVVRQENGEQDINIKKMDAATQKKLKLQAVIQSLNVTYDEAITKQQDEADKIESNKVAVENATLSWGKFIGILVPGIDAVGKLPSELAKIYVGLKEFGTELVNLKTLFPGFNSELGQTILGFIGLEDAANNANTALRNIKMPSLDIAGLKSQYLGGNGTIDDLKNALDYVGKGDQLDVILKQFGISKTKDVTAETGTGSTPKKSTGTKDQTDQEDIFLKQIQIEVELAKQSATYTANQRDAQLALVEGKIKELQVDVESAATGKEKLKQQENLLNYLREAESLRKDMFLQGLTSKTGRDVPFDREFTNGEFLYNEEQLIPRRKGGYSTLFGSFGRGQGNESTRPIEMSFDKIVGAASTAMGDFQTIANLTGLAKSDFGEIIALIQGLLGGISAGKSIFDTIMSFIPGGGIFATAAGALSGGGTSGGMIHQPIIGGGGRMQNIYVTVQSEVERTKAVKFFYNNYPNYVNREANKAV